MSSLQLKIEDEFDYSDLITEDDEPVDNRFSEKQQRLLAESVNLSWKPGRPFIGASNVGIYYKMHLPPLVPDMFVSMDVTLPEDIWKKGNRCYLVWEFGKPPEAAVEIVSNTAGSERGRKYVEYEQMGLLYYAVFDPLKVIQKEELRIFELTAGGYIPRIDSNLKKIGLSLKLWDGEYEGQYARWLRWCDADGSLLLTGKETYDRQCMQIEQERQNAEQERLRADRLARRLREMGIDPEQCE